MATNLDRHDFYPHGGPEEYSYTSIFGRDNNRGKTAQEAKANTRYPGIARKNIDKLQLLSNLQIIIDGAREAELSFLSATGVDLTQGSNAKAIFQNFNLILSSEKLFKRNLAMFKQLSNKINNKLIDPSKYFHTYLSQAIDKYAVKNNFNIRKATRLQLEEITNNILGYALEKTYSRFIEVIDEKGNIKHLEGTRDTNNQEQYQAMSEMIELISRLRSAGLFGKYGNMFNIEKILTEAMDEQTGIVVQKPTFTIQSFGQGGTPLELVSSTIAPLFGQIHQTTTSGAMSLVVTGEATGGSNYNEQKGDTIIAYAKGKVDFSKMEEIFKKHKGSGSKRLQNIDAFAEYLEKFGNEIEHLLVISDKNSAIKVDWSRGVHAQEKMTLNYVEPMLEKFEVPQVEALINYLANCGTEMIQKRVNNQVRTLLASYIAYFLFDHVEITGNIVNKTNVVNIINLSGTYIPLSVFLEGVYKSLETKLINSRTNANNLVSVTISLGGSVPSGKWTDSLWDEYRNNRLSGSSLEYNMMKDIASYITDLMA